MVDFQMPISTAHQRIVASEFVGINNRAAADGFNCQIQQCSSADIFNHLDFNSAVSFQDTEYRYFVGSSTATLAFAFAAKIGFIDLNFPIQ